MTQQQMLPDAAANNAGDVPQNCGPGHHTADNDGLPANTENP